MNLVADECVHGAIIDRLRTDGHLVRVIRDTNGGAVDPQVLSIATGERAVLLTQDKDFGELVYRDGLAHCGVVLIRLGGLSADERAERVSALCRDRADELPTAFTVIDRRGVRVRTADPPAA